MPRGPVDPLPHRVNRDLLRLVESEELGVSFFGAAARVAGTERARRDWNAMYELEVQTNAGVGRFIRQSGLALSDTHPVRWVGTAGGAATRVIPTAVRLTILREGTRRYLPAFRRLAEYYAGTEHAAFFDYVVAHELAIIAYADGARRRDGSALDAVNRLLDAGVPRS